MIADDALDDALDDEAPDDANDGMERVSSELQEESPRASELPAAPSGGGADVAIYALAGTVLALSLAGLYWLFTSH